jgi:hypothetical protein
MLLFVWKEEEVLALLPTLPEWTWAGPTLSWLAYVIVVYSIGRGGGISPAPYSPKMDVSRTYSKLSCPCYCCTLGGGGGILYISPASLLLYDGRDENYSRMLCWCSCFCVRGGGWGGRSLCLLTPQGWMHCTENPIYVFPEMKLSGLVPNSYIQVSVSNLYISESVCLFGCCKIGRLILGIYKLFTDTWKLKLGDNTLQLCFGSKEAVQFHFWVYINRNQTFTLDSHPPFICSVAWGGPYSKKL